MRSRELDDNKVRQRRLGSGNGVCEGGLGRQVRKSVECRSRREQY